MVLKSFQCFTLFSFCPIVIILLNLAINHDALKLRPKREGEGQLLRRTAPANPCLLKCKDNYMMSTEYSPHAHLTSNWRLDSAIGSPLHALAETAADANAIKRIDFECSYHAKFLSCLEKCGISPAAKILIEGQETLKTVCQSFKDDREFVGFVLPCLVRNGATIGKSCQLHWSLLEKDIFEALQSKTETKQNENEQRQKHFEDGIRQMCRALNSYTDCHLKTVAQLCHRRALSFFVQLNAKSSAALLRLLVGWAGFDKHYFFVTQQKWPECAQWHLDSLFSNGCQLLPTLSTTIFFVFFLFFAIIYQ